MVYENRIQRLQEILEERGLSGAVLSYSRDVYYYTGTAQPSYFVVLPDDHKLFVRRGFAFARREAGLETERVVPQRDLEAICSAMFPGSGAGEKVGAELDVMTVSQFRPLVQALGEREVVDLSADILTQRAIKDAGEVEKIKKACRAVHAGHLAMVSGLKAGASELELAAGVENAQRLAGHEGDIFIRLPDFFMSRGPITSGPNLRRTSGPVYSITGVGLSSAVPIGPSLRKVEPGDLVMVDIPACVEGYHADQSRTYAVGRTPDGASDLFLKLREVSDALIGRLSPGMTTGEAYALANARAAELGLGKAFMGFESQPNAHFVGHGIGLEVNEPPLIGRDGKVVLEHGMVLAIEMHVMIPGGPTVKLEDTVHLTHAGVQVLTMSPRELTLVG